MGCWNETCAFSRLAIHHGEPVRFLPLVASPWRIETLSGHHSTPVPSSTTGGSGCYIGDFWSPLTLPIRGTYNDYGSIEKVPSKTARDKVETAQLVNLIRHYAIRLKAGDNSAHDVATDDLKDLEAVLDGLQEGRLFTEYRSMLPQYPDRIVPIGWIMIKESVWQSLLSIDLLDTEAGYEWTPKGRKAYAKIARPKPTVTYLKRCYTRMTTPPPVYDETDPEALDRALADLQLMSSHYHRPYAFHHSAFASPLSSPDIHGELPKDLGVDKTQLVTAAAELDYVYMIAGMLRITLHPTAGSGSQGENAALWSKVSRRWMSDEAKVMKAREQY